MLIKDREPSDVIEEMTDFSKSLEKVLKSTDPVIYSLKYIPWKSYVMAALASAYYIDYPDMDSLLKTMQRIININLISGRK